MRQKDKPHTPLPADGGGRGRGSAAAEGLHQHCQASFLPAALHPQTCDLLYRGSRRCVEEPSSQQLRQLRQLGGFAQSWRVAGQLRVAGHSCLFTSRTCSVLLLLDGAREQGLVYVTREEGIWLHKRTGDTAMCRRGGCRQHSRAAVGSRALHSTCARRLAPGAIQYLRPGPASRPPPAGTCSAAPPSAATAWYQAVPPPCDAGRCRLQACHSAQGTSWRCVTPQH